MKFIFCLLFVFSTIFAYSHFPGRFDLVIEKDSVKSIEVKLNGISDKEEKVFFSLKTWDVSRQGKVQFRPFEDDWLYLTTSNLIVKPGETVSLKILVNTNGLTGSVWAEVQMLGVVPGAGFSLSKSIPIFLVVKGTEKIDLELKNFTISLNDGLLSTEIEMVNSGNIYIRPKVELEYLNRDQEKKQVIISSGQPIYPESSRVIKKQQNISDITVGKQPINLRLQFFDISRKIIEHNYNFIKEL